MNKVENDIFIIDDLHPEANAMLQALYSRSSKSARTQIEKAKKNGSNFMKKFYIGYNHESIGDCGSTTIFIENVSMIADKAIQTNQLYRGQETSSRYIDFSKRDIVEETEVSRRLLDFYIKAEPILIQHLKTIRSQKDDENEFQYENMIKARCFDILRGFLPAGITTQLSWHTDLRQAKQQIEMMKYHYLQEVKDIALKIESELKKTYPSSFDVKNNSDKDEYMNEISKYHFNSNTSDQVGIFLKAVNTKKSDYSQFFTFKSNILSEHDTPYHEYNSILRKRKRGWALPKEMKKLGSIHFDFCMDYGSWRDIQRHRNGYSNSTSLGAFDLGWNVWYTDNLPSGLKEEAIDILHDIFYPKNNRVNPLKEYEYPLCTNILVNLVYDIPQCVYVAELRSSKTVHPTARAIAHKIADAIIESQPSKITRALVLHIDRDEIDWDIKRGSQTIIEK